MGAPGAQADHAGADYSAVPSHPSVSVVLVAARDDEPFRAHLASVRAALDDGTGLLVVDTSDAGIALDPATQVVRAPGAGRRAALAAAAAAASNEVVVALATRARPRRGLVAPLAAAVSAGARLAAPLLETGGGPAHGYRRAPDGSLLPRTSAGDGPLDALALDCLAASRSFFAVELPDFSVDDGPYESAVAAAAGAIAVVPESRVERAASGPPATVAICTRNRVDEVGPCIDHLVAHGALADGCEIVVVDNGSTDGTPDVVRDRADRYGDGVRLVVEPVPGLSRARNAALAAARCETVLFLDDDARPAPGWLESLRDAFADGAVAVAGGPIHALWPPERPAGWPGAPLLPYLSVLSHGDGAHDVAVGDFYGANFACRRAAALAAGGFDVRFGFGGPAGLPGEEVALAARAAVLGLGPHRWVPGAAVGHRIDAARIDDRRLLARAFDQGRLLPWADAGYAEPGPASLGPAAAHAAAELTALTPLHGRVAVPAALAEIGASSRALPLRAHAAACLGRIVATTELLGERVCTVGPATVELAGPDAVAGRHVLVIANELPTWDRSSGGFRLLQIVELLRRAGDSVTFLARGAAGAADAAPYVARLDALGVRVIPVDPQRLRERFGVQTSYPPVDLEALLRAHPWDAVYVYFHEVAVQYLPTIRRCAPSAHVVVDSVDVHFVRERRAAELAGDATALARAEHTREAELAVYRAADAVVAVTDADRAALLAEEPGLRVDVVPNIHPLPPPGPGFAERSDLLFVGGFHHAPNVDAVRWLCAEIWPRLAERLAGARLHLVGADPPPEVQALSSSRVVVHGYVADLAPFLDGCRVSVAPLRYGAGMKGKVGEALAAGLPVVATTTAAEGMGLEPGRELVVSDDAEGFAAAVERLYLDAALWQRTAAAGRSHIASFAPDAVQPLLEAALAPRLALDTRTHVVIAFADELLEKPALLSAYGDVVGDGDPVTLAVLASPGEAAALAELLEGMPGCREADMVAFPPPGGALRTALAARASAVYSRADRTGYDALPRLGEGRLGTLRQLLGLDEAAAA